MPTKFRNVRKLQVVSNLLATMLQEKLQQAIAFHQNGQLPQAQALYEEILTTQPKHFDSLHLLAVIAYQTKQYQRAADLIGKAIELYPKNAAFYCNRGNALKELKQLDAAIASYDKAIVLNPDFAEAYSNRGVALQELEQLNAAVASFDKAIALKPNYAEAYSNRGNALKEPKQLDVALASCDKAIALKPDYAEAHSNRGNALKGLGQLEAALASYDKAVALKPGFAEAYSNRGNVLQELQQLDAAIASYDKAIALRPDYAEAYSHRGIALQELQQLDAALASYDKAIALKPGYADAHWNKSLALLLFGYFDRGWEEYEWRWKIGVSRQRARCHVGESPTEAKRLRLRSKRGDVARKQDGGALRQHARKECARSIRLQRTVNAYVASLHVLYPVAETVDNARRQQGSTKGVRSGGPHRRGISGDMMMRTTACQLESPSTPGGRNPAEETLPITVSGKWKGRRQGVGSGQTVLLMGVQQNAPGGKGPDR